MSNVEFWIEKFNANGTTVADEIEEVKGTISNERLWAKGSATPEETEMHLQNIEELTEYLEWLEEQLN